MKLQEAIRILSLYQKWRKGAEIPQPDSTRVVIAIDTILAHLRE